MVKCEFTDPPESFAWSTGSFDFRATGREWLKIFKTECNLSEDQNILDIGCGCGRIAIPIATAMPNIQYEGFDIVAPMVSWCQENISVRLQNFKFQHVDLRNDVYNPLGLLSGANHIFPYPDQCFDTVVAISVFTHLLPEVALQYLREIKRVLKPQGRALLTWHLLKANMKTWGYEHNRVARTMSSKTPEGFIAYHDHCVLNICAELALKPIKINHGTWHGWEGKTINWTVQKVMNYQDFIVVERAA